MFEKAFLDVIKGRCRCVLVLNKYLRVKASCAQSSRSLNGDVMGTLISVHNAAIASQGQDLISGILLFTLVFVRTGLIITGCVYNVKKIEA